MVVGEPSLMGGEFGEEDERLISRLENSQYDPAAAAIQHAAAVQVGYLYKAFAPQPYDHFFGIVIDWLSDECHDNQHFYNYCILCRKIAKCVFSTRTYAKVYPVRHMPFSSQWDLLRLTWGWKIPGSAPRWADGGLQVHRAQWESGHRRPADLAGSWACPEGRWEARPEGQWEAHPEGQWEVRPDHRRQAPLWSDRRRPTSNRSIPKSRPKTDWKLCELSEPDTD